MASTPPNSSRMVLNATRARQGRYGRQVLWVLLVSTALAALVVFGAWTWRAPDPAAATQHEGKPPADAPAFDVGRPVAQRTPPASRLP